MGYHMTWAFRKNVVAAISGNFQSSCRTWWLTLVDLLTVDGGWTVISSSDATTFGTTDLWAGNPAKLIWNTGTTARSHITLKSPEGLVAGLNGSYLGDQSRLWITINLAYATSGNFHQCGFVVHRVAPTGGSITALPTSADSIIYAAGTSLLYGSSANKNHMGVVKKGKTVNGVVKGTGAFYAFNAEGGIGNITGALVLLPVVDPIKVSGGLDYPFATAIQLAYVASGMFNYGSTGVFWNAQNIWTATGTVVTSDAFNITATSYPGVGTLQTDTGNKAGQSESGCVWLHCTTVGGRTVIGKVADMHMTGSNLTNFAIDNATPKYCYLKSSNYTTAGLWIPTDAELLP
jgi:hypothetical protein